MRLLQIADHPCCQTLLFNMLTSLSGIVSGYREKFSINPFRTGKKSSREFHRYWKYQQIATLFMILLAAFKVFLFRHARQEDIVVGIPIAGRNKPELENVIGLFIN